MSDKIEDVAKSLLAKLERVSSPEAFGLIDIDDDYTQLTYWTAEQGRFSGRNLALLQAKTAVYFCYANAEIYKKELGAKSGFDRYRDQAVLCLKEYLGLAPLRAEVRERDRWTAHWVSLFCKPGVTPSMKKDIIKTALKRYPDFDLSLFEED